MDQEEIHQTIYKHVHERMRPYLETEGIANAVWLGTEDAAKAIAAAAAPKKPRPYSRDCLASEVPGATCQSPNCDC